MTRSSITKEVHRLMRNIESFSNGQAKVVEWDPDCVEKITIELAPYDGPYKGGRFQFELHVEDLDSYPESPPRVNCLTKIYHPNIDVTAEEGENVCLSLFDEWQSSFGLEDCIQGLLFLLYNPNLDDPLSPLFEPGISEEEYLDLVKKSLKGEAIDYVEFEPNYYGNNGEENEDIKEDGVTVILENIEKDSSGCNEDNNNNEKQSQSENETNSKGLRDSDIALENDVTVQQIDNTNAMEASGISEKEDCMTIANMNICEESAEDNVTCCGNDKYTNSYVRQSSKISRQSSRIETTNLSNELDTNAFDVSNILKNERTPRTASYIFMDGDPTVKAVYAGFRVACNFACHYFKSRRN